MKTKFWIYLKAFMFFLLLVNLTVFTPKDDFNLFLLGTVLFFTSITLAMDIYDFKKEKQ